MSTGTHFYSNGTNSKPSKYAEIGGRRVRRSEFYAFVKLSYYKLSANLKKVVL